MARVCADDLQDDGGNTEDVDSNIDRVCMICAVESELLLEIERVRCHRHGEMGNGSRMVEWETGYIFPVLSKTSKLPFQPDFCPQDTIMDLESVPPITRAWGLLTLAVAVLEYTHTISSFQLFYTPSLVFRRWQIWRLVTTFLYFGPLGLDFLFHLFFFMRYSRMLEDESFGGRRGGKAGYLTLLLFSAACLLVLSPLTTQPFLGSPLAFVLVYIWSRRNRHVRLSLFGVLVITAPYLPWSLAAFGWLLHGSLHAVVGDLSGIAVGHLCKLFRSLHMPSVARCAAC